MPFPACIVVLSWNGRENTLDCLRSLSGVVDPAPKIILVDNGSADGTADAVRNGFPHVDVIETGGNLGYAGGNNVGIRRALALGAERILVLNNDTVVDPGFLKEMIAVMSRGDRIGFVSPKIYFHDAQDTIWFAGADFCTWCGYGRMEGYRERDRGQHDREREIGRPCGCAVLVSRELCEEVGLMEPSLFLYMEEVDWMLRAKRKGFTARYAPKGKVWHKVSASVGGENHPDALYYGVRNTLYALNTHRPISGKLPAKLRDLLVQAVFLASALRMRSGVREGFRAAMEGARDYRRSRMGRRGSGEAA